VGQAIAPQDEGSRRAPPGTEATRARQRGASGIVVLGLGGHPGQVTKT